MQSRKNRLHETNKWSATGAQRRERDIPAYEVQKSFSGGNSICIWIPYSYPINLLKVLDVGVITVLMILR